MSHTTQVGLTTCAAALALTGASMAGTTSEDQSMAAQIAELRAEVAQLKGENWLTEQRAEEIRGLVNDVLADADTRASLLQGGMNAGYDKGFFIGTPDGSFNLKMNGYIQFRFIYNNRDANKHDSDEDDNRWGFESTRTRLQFTGNVFDPSWGYMIRGNFSRDGGAFKLEDAWISHKCGNGWTALFGQMKVPLLREFLVGNHNQLLVERSNMVYYNPGASRTQGVAIDYRGDNFHFTGALSDGAKRSDSPWSSYSVMYSTEFAVTARAEVLFSGSWGQFGDFTSPAGSEQGIMAGVAAHYQVGEYGTPDDDEMSVFLLTGDLSFEFDGANIFAAVTYTSYDDDNGTDNEEIGFVVQGGIYFADGWEGFARYEYYDWDMSGYKDLGIVTAGVTRYFNSHVEWTTDVGYGVNHLEEANDVTGWDADESDEDGQFVLRTQMQLKF